jgi:hypothetical protein
MPQLYIMSIWMVLMDRLVQPDRLDLLVPLVVLVHRVPSLVS